MTLGGCAPSEGAREDAAEIDPVEAEDHVGLAQHLAHLLADLVEGADRMQRMVGREDRAGLEIGQHRRVQMLGQRNARLPGVRRLAGPAHQHHRPLGCREQARRIGDGFGIGA